MWQTSKRRYLKMAVSFTYTGGSKFICNLFENGKKREEEKNLPHVNNFSNF